MDYLAAAASVAASAMFYCTVIHDYLPTELRTFLSSSFDKLVSRFSSEHTIVIQETEVLTTNEFYHAASTYLRTRMTPAMRRLRVSMKENQNSITFSPYDGEELVESFNGVTYRWKFVATRMIRQGSRINPERSNILEVRWYELSFHKRHQDTTFQSYLPHILERAADIKSDVRMLEIYTNDYVEWRANFLNHPATFDTLAMEADLKKTIIEDLDRFVKRKEYYKRIGKAWKRGYLLFGPPGTGKSSLIVAMAKYLRYDIYDLNLKDIRENTDLKILLAKLKNKSLLVIENIDCTIELHNREAGMNKKKDDLNSKDNVILSELLNFIDGLWSGTGDERIIIFTTNYKERLDPALLRPGRMDMHIHLGYCGPGSFRTLASSYHTIDDHPMFEEIDGLLKEVEATPTEVAEQLMGSDFVEVALEGLIEFLKEKRDERMNEHKWCGEEDKTSEDVEYKSSEEDEEEEDDVQRRKRDHSDHEVQIIV